MHWIRQFIIYLTVATLLFLSIYSYFQFSEYKKYTRSVEHTHTVLHTVERLRGHIFQLMALRRGYLIDPHEALKYKYSEVREETRMITDTLAELVADNKQQVKNIRQIEQLYFHSTLFENEWLQNVAPYKTLVGVHNEYMLSKLMNDSIFNELRQVEKVERQLLGIRSGFQTDSGNSVPLMLLCSGVVAISMLLYAFFSLNSELREKLLAKEALEKNVVHLHEANGELERFAFIASHNLKEPLRKSRTFISRVLPDVDASSAVFPQLQKVEKSMERMQVMLDDLLDYSRLLKHNDKREQINLYLVTATVLKALNPLIVETGAVVYAENLPEVMGYSRQIHLVFTHLLANSMKYRKPDVAPIIKISSVRDIETGHFIVSFCDNGIGFDNTYTAKVFEVFGRLHSRDEYDGTGIGLPICRRVMFNHNGYILADGAFGDGSCFSLHFPIK